MSKKKTKKIIALILASLTGITGTSVAAAVMGYDGMFSRYDRPDYSTVMGEYYYERVKDRLPREEINYKPHSTTLRGYYYPTENAKGMVIISHGMHAGGDDYIPIAEFFVNNGYAVFSYDYTGTYSSKGEGTVGMCQPLIDLDATLNYLGKTEPYASYPKFLVGHSWGGYASSSVLALHPEVKGCLTIAAFNSGADVVMQKAEQYAGKAVYATAPILNTYQKILFGKFTEYNGVMGINSTTAPVIVAHGIDDESILYSVQSIICQKDNITNPNVIYYDGYGLQGDHNDIWHSVECALYKKKVESQLKLLKYQKGSDLSHEELADFVSTVDHRLYSEINYELFNLALDTFNKALE